MWNLVMLSVDMECWFASECTVYNCYSTLHINLKLYKEPSIVSSLSHCIIWLHTLDPLPTYCLVHFSNWGQSQLYVLNFI